MNTRQDRKPDIKEEVTVDFKPSDRIYREMDEFYNPSRMFALRARR